MKITEDSNIIEIFPDKEFATEVIMGIIKQRGYLGLNESIRRELGEAHSSRETLPSIINSFQFNGACGHEFETYDDVTKFKNGFEKAVSEFNKSDNNATINNSDDILFLVLLYYGYKSDLKFLKARWKYLDDLIEVFISLKNRRINVDEQLFKHYGFPFNSFENLVEADKEDCIYNDIAKVEARMIPYEVESEYGDKYFENSLIFIPNDTNIQIPNLNKKNEPIILPNRLSKILYTEILKEIIDKHSESDTKFFRCLRDNTIDIDTLKKREGVKNFKKDNLILYHLIQRIDSFLDTITTFKIKVIDKYVLIYNLLTLLKLLKDKPRDNKEKFQKIRLILKDDNPTTRRKKRGETQFFL